MSAELILAPLWPAERKSYKHAGIVLRLCMNCGLEQNHMGHDEPSTPEIASVDAPDARPNF
tara:strand:+ start:470 stop:652 length:183 start_codon:yes stop_codon:yes gene_type:complete